MLSALDLNPKLNFGLESLDTLNIEILMSLIFWPHNHVIKVQFIIFFP